MKKGTEQDVSKKRTRKTTKFQRSIQGATLENILAKRNQKPEVLYFNLKFNFSLPEFVKGCWFVDHLVVCLAFCQMSFNYPSLPGDRDF